MSFPAISIRQQKQYLLAVLEEEEDEAEEGLQPVEPIDIVLEAATKVPNFFSDSLKLCAPFAYEIGQLFNKHVGPDDSETLSWQAIAVCCESKENYPAKGTDKVMNDSIGPEIYAPLEVDRVYQVLLQAQKLFHRMLDLLVGPDAALADSAQNMEEEIKTFIEAAENKSKEELVETLMQVVPDAKPEEPPAKVESGVSVPQPQTPEIPAEPAAAPPQREPEPPAQPMVQDREPEQQVPPPVKEVTPEAPPQQAAAAPKEPPRQTQSSKPPSNDQAKGGCCTIL